MFYFKRKSELDKLEEAYKQTMRDSFNLALKDRQKSLTMHRKACQIQKKINMLTAKSY